jgi:MYXO-CTERM domain-containing protein
MAATPPGLTCPPGGNTIAGTLNISVTPNDGVQTGRFTRAGNPASTCAVPHAAPITQDPAANFGFDKYTFTNRSTAAQCITVTLQATSAGASGELQSAAYSGSSSAGTGFVPTSIVTNYLGDSGPGTATSLATYSFNVAALADFEVVVSESNDGQGGGYVLNVSGCGQIAISNISPAFGHKSGGTLVGVSGSGFSPTGVAPTVTFGVDPAPVSPGFTDSFFTTTAPAHLTGPFPAVVALNVQQNPSGAIATANPGFTYYDDITTSTTLTSSANPSVFGQPVVLTATVALTSPNPGLPAPGNVQFFDGATLLGTAAVNASGVATLVVSGFSVATHSLTATYAQAPAPGAGDLVYLTSTSTPALAQLVDQSGTTTSVSSSTNPSAIGSSVTFTATVAALAPGAGTPTGTVTFSSDGIPFATGVTLDANGQATTSTTALALGAHAITVSYSGDTNFAPSVTNPALTQTVTATGTAITIVANPASPSTFGQAVTFTVTLSSLTGGTPTGTVIFRDGPLATSPQIGTTQTVSAGGTAAITIATLAEGNHTIRAEYSGDANHQAVVGTLSPYVVNAAPTTTTLTSSVNPSAPAQSVTFTATVTSTVAGTIGGTVTFKDGATTLGTGTVGAGGAATLATAALAVGSHNITAVYGGAGNFATSTSAILVQVVRVPTPDAGADAAEAGKDSSTPDAAKPDTGTTDSGSPTDSGTPRVDSSTDDAGQAVNGVLGGGGCDCAMTATPSSSALSVLMWAGVGILVARRRKRSNKR